MDHNLERYMKALERYVAEPSPVNRAGVKEALATLIEGEKEWRPTPMR